MIPILDKKNNGSNNDKFEQKEIMSSDLLFQQDISTKNFYRIIENN